MRTYLSLFVILFGSVILFRCATQTENDSGKDTPAKSPVSREEHSPMSATHVNAPMIQWDSRPRIAHGAKGAVELHNGHILSARTGPAGAGVGVVCSRSSNGGKSWFIEGVIVSDHEIDADIGDGCLLQLASGEILYSYRQNRYRGSHSEAPYYSIKTAVSRDEGVTWEPHSTVMEVRPSGGTPSQGLWSSFLLETSHGELQCYYDDEYTPSRKGFRGHQWLQMRTWDPVDKTWEGEVTVSRAFEPALLSRDGMGSVVEISPDRLVCALESVQTSTPHAGVVRYVTSEDGGRTWSWAAKERGILYEPQNSKFSAYAAWIARLQDESLLCVFVTNEDRSVPDKPGTPPPELNCDLKYVVGSSDGRQWSAVSEMLYSDGHNAYMPGITVLRHGPDAGAVLVLFLDTEKGFLSIRGRSVSDPSH